MLRYHEGSGRVNEVKNINGIDNMPILCFGEDEQGEAYMTDAFGQIWGLEEERRSASD